MLHGQSVFLIGQQGRLGGHDRGVSLRASFILIQRDLHGLRGVSDGCLLSLRLFGQNPQVG